VSVGIVRLACRSRFASCRLRADDVDGRGVERVLDVHCAELLNHFDAGATVLGNLIDVLAANLGPQAERKAHNPELLSYGSRVPMSGLAQKVDSFEMGRRGLLRAPGAEEVGDDPLTLRKRVINPPDMLKLAQYARGAISAEPRQPGFCPRARQFVEFREGAISLGNQKALGSCGRRRVHHTVLEETGRRALTGQRGAAPEAHRGPDETAAYPVRR
jgi:hypothetical protein